MCVRRGGWRRCGGACGAVRRRVWWRCWASPSVAAGCTDDSPGPDPDPSDTATQQPAVLTFGVYGPDERTGRLPRPPSRRGTPPPKVPRSRSAPGPTGSGCVPRSSPASRSPTCSSRRAPTCAGCSTRATPSRSTSCSTSAASTSATATRAMRSRPSASTTGCSACRTPSRRWSSTTTRRSSTSSGCATAAWTRPRTTPPAGRSSSSPRPPTFATRPRRGTKGVHIAPTIPGLSPFIESGGGSVFDDAVDPTSLSFSSDDSQAALERTLELLRNPRGHPRARTSSPRPAR